MSERQVVDARAVRLRERIAHVNRAASLADAADAQSDWRPPEHLLRVGVWQDRLQALRATEETYARCMRSDDFATADAPHADIDAFAHELVHAEMGAAADPTPYTASVPPLPRPIAALVANRLAAALEGSQRALSDVCDIGSVCRGLLDSFLCHLQELVASVLVTELHVCRNEGVLQGETPEGRYADFTERLIHEPGWVSALFDRYPVLARHLIVRIPQWAARTVELLERVSADYDHVLSLCQALPAPASSTVGDHRPHVTRISGPTGDTHRGGQAVCFVDLSDSSRVVYKPRSLAIDLAFERLIEWLNEHGATPALKSVDVVDRGTHGWCRFVASAPCADREAVARFYARQGAHLAILYVLGGYDFFWENVKASGEYPFLIDLECVASPTLPRLHGALFDSASRRYFNESVARAGLLPSWSWSNGVEVGVNVGALSDIAGQLFPHDVPIWLNLRRDDLHQGRTRVEFQVDRSHLPRFDGEAVTANDFLNDLVAGFRSTYRIFLAHRDGFLDGRGPLAGFADGATRAVVRPTRDYALLLQEMLHPDYLQHATASDAFLENLWRSSCPRYPVAVIQSEIDQLWNGDVPYFALRGGSQTLFDAADHCVVESYIEESTMDGIRRRVARLSNADCDLQIEIMMRAFSTVDLPVVGLDDGLLVVRDRSLEVTDHVGAGDRYVLEASAIADRLLDVAIADEKSMTWIGLSMAIDGRWQQTSLDDSLYDGGIGIALFLLYVHRLTGLPRYRHAVELIMQGGPVRALQVVAEGAYRLQDWVLTAPSGFELPCSALYLFGHVDALWGTDHLAQAWDAAARWLEIALTRKPRFDLISGATGIVLQMLRVYRWLDDPRALHIARQYGEAILAQGVWRSDTLSWKNELFEQPLVGMTHGTCGCAWALQSLGTATEDERFLRASRAALAFDRSMAWPDGPSHDPRISRKTERFMSWCHGASGLAMARALIYEQTADPELISEIERYVAGVLASDESSDCLCHGLLGNLDCVQRAGLTLGRADWLDEVQRRLSHLWVSSRSSGLWRCGMPHRNVSLPGLFMGLAGIGFGLLRVTHPGVVPSVLALDGPVAGAVAEDKQRAALS